MRFTDSLAPATCAGIRPARCGSELNPRPCETQPTTGLVRFARSPRLRRRGTFDVITKRRRPMNSTTFRAGVLLAFTLAALAGCGGGDKPMTPVGKLVAQ